jgi:hypothetical protein
MACPWRLPKGARGCRFDEVRVRFASATGAQTAGKARHADRTKFERLLMLFIPTLSSREDRRNADLVVQPLPGRR